MAIMCRNHRGFVEATVAIAKLGAHALYLNTAFAGPQLTEVVKREKPVAIVYDEEFTELLEDAGKRRKRFIAWHDSDDLDDPTLEELIESGLRRRRPCRPRRPAGRSSSPPAPPARRRAPTASSPQSLDPAVSLLSKIPLRSR